MFFLISLLNLFFGIAYFVILAHWALKWLVVLEIVPPSNPAARDLIAKGDALLAPIYTPIRKVLPPIAGIDFAPLVAVFGLSVVQYIVVSLLWSLSVPTAPIIVR